MTDSNENGRMPTVRITVSLRVTSVVPTQQNRPCQQPEGAVLRYIQHTNKKH